MVPPPSLGEASSSSKGALSKREIDKRKEKEVRFIWNNNIPFQYNDLFENVTTTRLGSRKRNVIDDE